MWVIGTAGHIDHGKSTLVRALTGVDPDRLPEEQARGITIELGFAPLQLGPLACAIVDVPGHERFVQTMVAGATGIDLVLLVVAADDGVMPQTREHLAICDLLGVRAAVAVVTRCDLVDDVMAGACADEVADLLADTSLRGAPIVRASARTGAGLDDVRAALTAQLALVRRDHAGEPTRLPIDRVFTVKGVGTVVTGTLRGAPLVVGDELVVLPHGRPVRVRGLQLFGAAAASVDAPARVAVNLDGASVRDLARGEVLARAGDVACSHLLDVRLRRVDLARGPTRWPRRRKVRIGHGTACVDGVLTISDEVAAPRERGAQLAQIRLARGQALPALPGDRFIVFASGRTIGGGEIIRPLAARARASRAGLAATLDAVAPATRLRVELEQAGIDGRAEDQLVPRLGLARAALDVLVAAAIADGGAVRLAGRLLAATTMATIDAALRATVGDRAVPLTELRAALPGSASPAVRRAAVEALVARGELHLDDAGLVRRRGVAAATSHPLDARLIERFAAWGLAPPRPADVPAEVNAPPADVRASMTRLLTARVLVKVNPDYVVAAAAYDAIKTALLATLAARGEITTAAWKDLTGVSRKHAIPLAEHFDAARVTKRVGDVRRAWK